MKTFWQIVLTIAVIALIVFGGRIERGYYAVASEPFVAVVMIGWIIYTRKANLTKYKK